MLTSLKLANDSIFQLVSSLIFVVVFAKDNHFQKMYVEFFIEEKDGTFFLEKRDDVYLFKKKI